MSSMLESTIKSRAALLICLSLALVTLAVYWPVFRCDFNNGDDPSYVTQNPHVQSGLTLANLRWALFARHSNNWHPLTWISHMADCELYGLNPAGHHATNLMFHVANAVLIFLLLRRATGAQWRSAFVAALFALHPLHVESVAWVSERKDVLSTFFWALTIWAYVRYSERPGLARYLLVSVLFVLGLMSKPMLVTLPCLLLLLDFWPLRRAMTIPEIVEQHVDASGEARRTRAVSWKWLVLEKVPLLVLALVASAITLWAQSATVGAVKAPLWFRLLNALCALVQYMEKMVWPSGLAVLYPYPQNMLLTPLLIAGIVVGGMSYLAVRQASKRPYLFTGWFWFVGTLTPVIGLVQVGIQSMADRYTYVPLIGLFIVIAWGGCELSERWRLWPGLPGFAAALAVAACVPVTVTQLAYWRNSVVLCEHTLQCTANNYMIEYALGMALSDRGQMDAACQHLEEAIRMAPAYAPPHCQLAQILSTQGKAEAAVASFREAIRCDPSLSMARQGLVSELIQQNKLGDAAEELNAWLWLTPDNWEAADTLGGVLTRMGRPSEALSHFNEAARINPTNALVRCHLAMTLNQLGRTREEISQYREALKIEPQTVEALNNLAWILAANPSPEIRDGNEAVRLSEQACRLTGYRIPELVGTLGVAYAETGRFEEAARMADQAAAMGAAAGKTVLAERAGKMAELFRGGKPFHDAPRQPITAPENGGR
jgi:tetratricopeptide (TPR) repeat protein